MREEAEKHAEEDAAKKETIEIRNQAESLVFQTEKTLKEHGDNVPVEVGQTVTEKVEALKEVLKKEDADTEAIKSSMEELNAEIQKIGESMYQQPGAEAPTEDDDSVRVKDVSEDEVVEGETVEEDSE